MEKFLENRKKFVDEVIESLEKEKSLVWLKKWGTLGPPFNPTTNKEYNGNNNLMLSFRGMQKGYEDTRWLTYKQAQNNKWQVKKGEKATSIEFFELYDKKTKKQFDPKSISSLSNKEQIDYKNKNVYSCAKAYSVFNGEQIDNIPAFEKPKIEVNYNKIDKIIENSNVPFFYDSENAFYSSNKDEIHMPHQKFFKSENAFYGTVLHELSHSTGHELRMNRNIHNKFGSESYAKEELRAEFSSFFIAQSKGITYTNEDKENTKAYLQSWIKALKNDPNEFFKAGKEANKIANKVLSYENEKQPSMKDLIKTKEQIEEKGR